MPFSPGRHPARACWRLLDTGSATAAQNIALDAAQLELRAAGKIPDTLRFLQFSPASVLIGRHQTVAREVRTDYCREQEIEINRRITGGGAIYFGGDQLGWEIIASRQSLNAGPTMADLTKHICDAAVDGLNRLGLSASFRPRNDIEIGGRKISGTGGAWEGDAFLFQGTLLIDFDPEVMIRAMRIPVEKLSRHELYSARERVTCLTRELGHLPQLADIKAALTAGFSGSFNAEIQPGFLSDAEMDLATMLLPHYESAGWIDEISEPVGDHGILESMHGGRGGLIRTSVSIDLKRRRIKHAFFSGDFFVKARRSLFDLEAGLKDCNFDKAEARVEKFFVECQPEFLDLDAADFQQGLHACLEKTAYPGLGIPIDTANAISIVNSSGLEDALGGAGVLLLPYCAKAPDCEHRGDDGCDECGECSVGEAYALARAKGMLPISVCSYKHLEAVLTACREAGVVSYVGCCCQAFLAKRLRVFTAAGIAGTLIDIEDTTCYELQEEEEAYSGRFQRQTRLNLALLQQLLKLVPERISPPQIDMPSVPSPVLGTRG
jgi:lipoate-protein ligase A